MSNARLAHALAAVRGPDGAGNGEAHCSVCGDEAIEGRVLHVDDATATARVATACGEEDVAIDLVPGVARGDRVMLHQGFAISRVGGGTPDYTAELYPFLSLQPARADATALERATAAVRASVLQKCADVVALRRQLHAEYRATFADAGVAMARAFARGAKLLAFGNGGSATDAHDAVADCVMPPRQGWRALPAISLVRDVGVLTAVSNDVGFEHVFARQVAAFGRRGDVAIAFSTSGNSPSVLQGLREARRRELLTIGLTGYDGGSMARDGSCDFCFVARAEYVPRLQEGHAMVWHTLLAVVQEELGA